MKSSTPAGLPECQLPPCQRSHKCRWTKLSRRFPTPSPPSTWELRDTLLRKHSRVYRVQLQQFNAAPVGEEASEAKVVVDGLVEVVEVQHKHQRHLVQTQHPVKFVGAHAIQICLLASKFVKCIIGGPPMLTSVKIHSSAPGQARLLQENETVTSLVQRNKIVTFCSTLLILKYRKYIRLT